MSSTRRRSQLVAARLAGQVAPADSVSDPAVVSLLVAVGLDSAVGSGLAAARAAVAAGAGAVGLGLGLDWVVAAAGAAGLGLAVAGAAVVAAGLGLGVAGVGAGAAGLGLVVAGAGAGAAGSGPVVAWAVAVGLAAAGVFGPSRAAPLQLMQPRRPEEEAAGTTAEEAPKT